MGRSARLCAARPLLGALAAVRRDFLRKIARVGGLPRPRELLLRRLAVVRVVLHAHHRGWSCLWSELFVERGVCLWYTRLDGRASSRASCRNSGIDAASLAVAAPPPPSPSPRRHHRCSASASPTASRRGCCCPARRRCRFHGRRARSRRSGGSDEEGGRAAVSQGEERLLEELTSVPVALPELGALHVATAPAGSGTPARANLWRGC